MQFPTTIKGYYEHYRKKRFLFLDFSIHCDNSKTRSISIFSPLKSYGINELAYVLLISSRRSQSLNLRQPKHIFYIQLDWDWFLMMINTLREFISDQIMTLSEHITIINLRAVFNLFLPHRIDFTSIVILPQIDKYLYFKYSYFVA